MFYTCLVELGIGIRMNKYSTVIYYPSVLSLANKTPRFPRYSFYLAISQSTNEYSLHINLLDFYYGTTNRNPVLELSREIDRQTEYNLVGAECRAGAQSTRHQLT